MRISTHVLLVTNLTNGGSPTTSSRRISRHRTTLTRANRRKIVDGIPRIRARHAVVDRSPSRNFWPAASRAPRLPVRLPARRPPRRRVAKRTRTLVADTRRRTSPLRTLPAHCLLRNQGHRSATSRSGPARRRRRNRQQARLRRRNLRRPRPPQLNRINGHQPHPARQNR